MKSGPSLSLLALARFCLAVCCWFTCGCETLIGADFDSTFRRLGKCEPACSAEQRCDLSVFECVCAPAPCPEGSCGTLLDSRCGQPIDCGGCGEGQYCGSETPNTCSTVPCSPQTCEQLGQASGVHPSCGMLVDCNPQLSCDCEEGETCTSNGCCRPFPHPEKVCGFLENGCGQQAYEPCAEGTVLVCHAGECCDPTRACDASGVTCGPTPACGGYVDCAGSCPDGQTCQVHFDGLVPLHRCGSCTPSCPADPVCGLNEDSGCPGQSILCPGSCPDGQRCRPETFSCCEPQCPGMPAACGANPDGCGQTIQCPGPCPLGETCRAASNGTYACAR